MVLGLYDWFVLIRKVSSRGGGFMDLIGEFTRRLYWEMAPVFNWAFNNWAISVVSLLLLIRWAGHGRRAAKHI